MRGPKKDRNFLGSSLRGWTRTAATRDGTDGVPGDRRTPSGSPRRGPTLGTAAQSPLNTLVNLLRT
ncbi:hypothetical protein [Halopelagius longus]|uniref:Uncharacterized protein n=1 Tax=Halopelagius longus TaxID=1236180 RepID=A0A1H1EVW2_9EURY|nr:hypothetical protein [Halopelagius longus]RDI71911.1 hypothetical protein DWB78_09355 [Halopelagius longus]SDQ92830.1 hypothetical protein SAMN05216278_3088 [Halopelagius longus]